MEKKIALFKGIAGYVCRIGLWLCAICPLVIGPSILVGLHTSVIFASMTIPFIVHFAITTLVLVVRGDAPIEGQKRQRQLVNLFICLCLGLLGVIKTSDHFAEGTETLVALGAAVVVSIFAGILFILAIELTSPHDGRLAQFKVPKFLFHFSQVITALFLVYLFLILPAYLVIERISQAVFHPNEKKALLISFEKMHEFESEFLKKNCRLMSPSEDRSAQNKFYEEALRELNSATK